jgi:hypothetical protein
MTPLIIEVSNVQAWVANPDQLQEFSLVTGLTEADSKQILQKAGDE